MTLVAVKLTDAEWRVKCEELAEQELRRKKKRETLAEEAEEWKDRKKDLDGQIEKISDRCEALALEVSNRETMRDAQKELPLQETSPPPTTPSSDSEEPPAENEPGSEG